MQTLSTVLEFRNRINLQTATIAFEHFIHSNEEVDNCIQYNFEMTDLRWHDNQILAK